MEQTKPQTPQTPVKKRPGAPKGNQNARKHGFYSDVLDDEEYQALKEIRGYEDLDGEIDVMRVKIQSVLRHDPNNVRLIIEATSNLARLMKTRDKLTIKQRNKMRDGIETVWRELGTKLLSEENQRRVLTKMRDGTWHGTLDKTKDSIVSPKK